MRIEPGTFRVLGERDNRYTTETLRELRREAIGSRFLMTRIWFSFFSSSELRSGARALLAVVTFKASARQLRGRDV